MTGWSMSLKQTLQSDLQAAIKSRDELTAATLRMALIGRDQRGGRW